MTPLLLGPSASVSVDLVSVEPVSLHITSAPSTGWTLATLQEREMEVTVADSSVITGWSGCVTEDNNIILRQFYQEGTTPYLV